MVALLRGINVGGSSRLAMADLRSVAEQQCGFGHVRTYIQSGNLVFTTNERPAAAATSLADALSEHTSVSPAVIVRSKAQLDDVIAGNPFLPDGPDPAHLHVVFMPRRANVDPVDPDGYLPEAVRASGEELYFLLPGGVGRSKLAEAMTRGAGAPAAEGTMRNWRTVTTLGAMAAEIA